MKRFVPEAACFLACVVLGYVAVPSAAQAPSIPRVVVIDPSGTPAHEVTVVVDGYSSAVRVVTTPVVSPITPTPGPNPPPTPPPTPGPNPPPTPPPTPPPDPKPPEPKPNPVDPSDKLWDSAFGIERIIAEGWNDVDLPYGEKVDQATRAYQNLDKVIADVNPYIIPNGGGKGHDDMTVLLQKGFAALDSFAIPSAWAPCIGKAKLAIQDQLAAGEYADNDGYADALALTEALGEVVIGLKQCVGTNPTTSRKGRR